MPTIQQIYEIMGPVEDVWQALTDPARIVIWSDAPAAFTPEPGSEYSLWGGDIRGRVIEATPNERLIQTWRPENYPDDSLVTFTLTPTGEGTRIELLHENVPDWDYDATNQGWDVYYLGAIKKMIESRSPGRRVPARRAPAKKATAKKATAKKGASRRAAAKKTVRVKRSARKAKGTAKKASARNK